MSTIPKRAAEDTSLAVDNVDGGKTTFPVPSGTELRLHLPALHYNRMLGLLPFPGPILTEVTARYWKDPHTFRPERFLGDWPRDAFMPFSSGRFDAVMTLAVHHEFA